jgi:GNAT superfamily N-acetyltransferase
VPAVELHEIAVTSETDLALLRSFYEEIYQVVFPNPDERESFESLISYLRDADDAGHEHEGAGRVPRPNGTARYDYHVVVMLAGGEPIGGSIFDYFADPNCGVIEFLCVGPTSRRSGYGRQLLEHTESILRSDAKRRGTELGWIIAEMDDPFTCGTGAGDFDPFARALVWHRWGYGVVDFPYVQPALSAAQQPVRTLLLMAKPPCAPAGGRPTFGTDRIPGEVLTAALHEYLRWAMRIVEPASNPEYRRMVAHLVGRDAVALIRLDEYIGEPSEQRLVIKEVVDAEDPALDDAVAVYATVFTDPAEAVPAASLRGSVSRRAGPSAGCVHHLWAVYGESGQPCEGMASFFTLPSSGFGGYVALTGSVRGQGLLGPLLRMMERRMVRDDPSNAGWYIECGEHTDRAKFARYGFRTLAVDYHQPLIPRSASAESAGLALHLLYKPFGRVYGDGSLRSADLLAAVGDILRSVYDVEQPLAHPSYQSIASQLGTATTVPFT